MKVFILPYLIGLVASYIYYFAIHERRPFRDKYLIAFYVYWFSFFGHGGGPLPLRWVIFIGSIFASFWPIMVPLYIYLDLVERAAWVQHAAKAESNPSMKIQSNGTAKGAERLREWAYHSESVTALLALGPSSDGSFSLASKNSAIWAAARSAEEEQVMLFVVLSAATLVLIKHNKTGDGVAALLGAMNVVDGIPDFAPLVVAFRHAVAALEDIEQHQGHKDESKRSELLQKSKDLEKNWGEMAAALLKEFGGRSFLE